MSSICFKPDQAYAKDPNLKREDVEILQEWLKKQHYLPKLEECQVIICLHSCYYKIEAAKSTIDYYFSKKTHFPQIFKSASEGEVKDGFATTSLQILPERTPEGYVIVMAALVNYKPEVFDFTSTVRLAIMIISLAVHSIPCPNGAILIISLQGVSLGHLLRLNPTVLKHLIDFVQEGLPVRLKKIHFVHVVPIMDKILTLLKSLMKSELYDLIEVHSSLDKFYECVPRKCLTEECGGDFPPYNVLQELQIKTLLDNYDFFKWHDGQVVDESKRLGRVRSDLFGEEGTFKKLSID